MSRYAWEYNREWLTWSRWEAAQDNAVLLFGCIEAIRMWTQSIQNIRRGVLNTRINGQIETVAQVLNEIEHNVSEATKVYRAAFSYYASKGSEERLEDREESPSIEIESVYPKDHPEWRGATPEEVLESIIPIFRETANDVREKVIRLLQDPNIASYLVDKDVAPQVASCPLSDDLDHMLDNCNDIERYCENAVHYIQDRRRILNHS